MLMHRSPQRVNRQFLRHGTSLVELLVVMVVFLVGILAIVQIFPGGFRVLNTTRNNSVASAFARQQIEQLKSRSEQLPDAIVPIQYVFNPDSCLSRRIRSAFRTILVRSTRSLTPQAICTTPAITQSGRGSI